MLGPSAGKMLYWISFHDNHISETLNLDLKHTVVITPSWLMSVHGSKVISFFGVIILNKRFSSSFFYFFLRESGWLGFTGRFVCARVWEALICVPSTSCV